jgi:hypothetical protein
MRIGRYVRIPTAAFYAACGISLNMQDDEAPTSPSDETYPTQEKAQDDSTSLHAV